MATKIKTRNKEQNELYLSNVELYYEYMKQLTADLALYNQTDSKRLRLRKEILESKKRLEKELEDYLDQSLLAINETD